MDVYIRSSKYILAHDFEKEVISNVQSLKGIFGALNLDKSSSFYPERSDLKIMRNDVIASIIIIGELISNLKYSDEILQDMGLFVANGVFLENDNKNIKRMMKILQRISRIEDKSERMSLVFRGISPLSALETLTNSATSFIAQYGKLGGNNTTFGNTSYSGSIAIAEGLSCLESQSSQHMLIGGVNSGGAYSALTNINCYDDREGWFESACSAFILLQNEKNNCNVKITKYKHDSRVPSLIKRNEEINWQQFFNNVETAEMIIYSGGFTPSAFLKNKVYVDSLCLNSFTWNEKFGNLGSSSMVMNIIKGVYYIESGQNEVIDVLDYDAYGRETYFQISKI